MPPTGTTNELTSEAISGPLTARPIQAVPLQSMHDEILKMTAEVFPGARVEFAAGADPEIENEEYFVVSVASPGTVPELVARDVQWHRRVRMIAADATRFYRLSLEVA